MQFEDYALRLNASAFARRSKAKAKPQRRTSASSSTGTIFIGERTWTDIEPQEYSLCKDNTSNDPFSRCETCKNLGNILSGRSQRQEHH